MQHHKFVSIGMRVQVRFMTQTLLYICSYIEFNNKIKEIKIVEYSEPKYKLWNWQLYVYTASSCST